MRQRKPPPICGSPAACIGSEPAGDGSDPAGDGSDPAGDGNEPAATAAIRPATAATRRVTATSGGNRQRRERIGQADLATGSERQIVADRRQIATDRGQIELAESAAAARGDVGQIGQRRRRKIERAGIRRDHR